MKIQEIQEHFSKVCSCCFFKYNTTIWRKVSVAKKIEMRVKLKQCFGGGIRKKTLHLFSDSKWHCMACSCEPNGTHSHHSGNAMAFITKQVSNVNVNIVSVSVRWDTTFLSGLLEPLGNAARKRQLCFNKSEWRHQSFPRYFELVSYNVPTANLLDSFSRTFWSKPSNVTCLMYFVYFSLAKHPPTTVPCMLLGTSTCQKTLLSLTLLPTS